MFITSAIVILLLISHNKCCRSKDGRMSGEDVFGVSSVFSQYGNHLEAETEKKEGLKSTIKELEQTARDLYTLLQRVHRPGGVKETSGMVVKAKEKFAVITEKFRSDLSLSNFDQHLFILNRRELDGKLPQDGYWRYSYLWTNTTSWISFLASLTFYLEHEKLASKEEVEKLVGLVPDSCNTLKLDIEEYLIGLTHLSNELVIKFLGE